MKRIIGVWGMGGKLVCRPARTFNHQNGAALFHIVGHIHIPRDIPAIDEHSHRLSITRKLRGMSAIQGDSSPQSLPGAKMKWV